jgi:hypothetical protein
MSVTLDGQCSLIAVARRAPREYLSFCEAPTRVGAAATVDDVDNGTATYAAPNTAKR